MACGSSHVGKLVVSGHLLRRFGRVLVVIAAPLGVFVIALVRGDSIVAAAVPVVDADALHWGVLDVPTGGVLPPVEGEVSAAVFGDDGRVRTPASNTSQGAIAWLELEDEDGDKGSCTGTVVGAGVVLTAAHCLVADPDEPRITRVRVVPGKQGSREPWGSQFAAGYMVPEGWQHSTIAAQLREDFGLVFLSDRQLTDRSGVFPGRLTALEDREFADATARFSYTGYPGDCDDTRCNRHDFLYPNPYPWTAGASFVSADSGLVYDDADTAGGMSGSALTRGTDLAITAVLSSGGPFVNSGVRMNSRVLACARGSVPPERLQLERGSGPGATSLPFVRRGRGRRQLQRGMLEGTAVPEGRRVSGRRVA